MYYFYVNFPNFSSDPIKIHDADCSYCKNGNGLHDHGSNQRGFWAGPFNTYSDIEDALKQLDQKFSTPPGFEDAGCCNPGSSL
jgi:hypothetical protein